MVNFDLGDILKANLIWCFGKSSE